VAKNPSADAPSFDAPSDATSLAVEHARAILRIIWKRRWSALSFLLIVMTVVAVYTFSQKPTYKATAVIRINKDDLKVLSFESFVIPDESTDELIKTEVEVIRSRNLAEKVAQALNLGADADFQRELQPGFPRSLIAHFSETPGPDDINEDDRKESVVKSLLDMLDLDPVRGSRLVKLSVVAHNSKLAAEIANTWAEIYIRNCVDMKMQASRTAGVIIDKQVSEQQAHLEDIERKLHASTKHLGLHSFEDMKANNAQRVTELNTMITEAEADRIRKRVTYDSMKSDPLGSSIGITDVVVQKLREEVAKLEGEYSTLLKTFKPQYPDCIRLQARIGQLRRSIDEQAQKWVRVSETECRASEQRVAALRKELEIQQQEAMRLQDAAVDYNILKRELESSTQHYQALLARSKEAVASTQIKASKVSVVDAAKMSRYAYRPRVALNLLLALIVGTVVGCGACVMLDMMDNSIRTAEDVEKELGESLLGMVPEIEEDDEIGENRDLISHLDSKSTASEAYRAIRTSLAFSSPQGEVKNIVISSAMPGEGKTITAINIATVLGQGGEKVLLVDADMRRPRLHRSLHLPNNRGLSTYLVNKCRLGDIVMPSCIPNVDVIVSGPTPPNPSELLNSDRMTQLLEECRKRYDRVLIDTPPVMAVTDSRLAAAKADGLIHVIQAGKTDKRCAKLAKKHFDTVGARVIGAVLNNVESEHGDSSYYYYYHRTYSN